MDQERNPTGKNHLGWRCGSCHELISSVEDGWVEWLAPESDQDNVLLKGLRLVHRSTSGGRCRYDFRREFQQDRSIAEGLPLERFVGPDGLMLLLSLLAAGQMPRDDVLELAKRVQIPGYEQARELLRDAQLAGIMTPAIADGYYLQLEIRALLRWTSERTKPVREG